jgi:hypothetical protein
MSQSYAAEHHHQPSRIETFVYRHPEKVSHAPILQVLRSTAKHETSGIPAKRGFR